MRQVTFAIIFTLGIRIIPSRRWERHYRRAGLTVLLPSVCLNSLCSSLFCHLAAHRRLQPIGDCLQYLRCPTEDSRLCHPLISSYPRCSSDYGWIVLPSLPPRCLCRVRIGCRPLRSFVLVGFALLPPPPPVLLLSPYASANHCRLVVVVQAIPQARFGQAPRSHRAVFPPDTAAKQSPPLFPNRLTNAQAKMNS